MSVTGSTARTSLATLESLVPRIRAAAQAIGHEADNWRFPEEIRQAGE
jgi:DNA-binding IclR family transcriptional regulator